MYNLQRQIFDGSQNINTIDIKNSYNNWRDFMLLVSLA